MVPLFQRPPQGVWLIGSSSVNSIRAAPSNHQKAPSSPPYCHRKDELPSLRRLDPTPDSIKDTRATVALGSLTSNALRRHLLI